MSEIHGVLRFEPDGPPGVGMERWEDMNPDDLVAGTPVQNGHTYHEDAGAGYLAGVWDCTAFTDAFGPYAVDEFMWLIDGSVIMVMPDGAEVTVEAGQAFVLPKGLQCQWKQPGYVRKFFMILDGPVPDMAANPALSRVTVPDLGPVPLPPGAVEARRTDFVNAAGNMQVAQRNLAAVTLPPQPSAASHLIQVLEGQLQLSDAAGEHSFAPGETAYVPQGSVTGWRSVQGTRLLQASFRL